MDSCSLSLVVLALAGSCQEKKQIHTPSPYPLKTAYGLDDNNVGMWPPAAETNALAPVMAGSKKLLSIIMMDAVLYCQASLLTDLRSKDSAVARTDGEKQRPVNSRNRTAPRGGGPAGSAGRILPDTGGPRPESKHEQQRDSKPMTLKTGMDVSCRNVLVGRNRHAKMATDAKIDRK